MISSGVAWTKTRLIFGYKVVCIKVNVKIIENNLFKNQRFKAMFPDSNIAKAYSQGETKVKYYIQFGIAPYFKDELVKDIKGAGFCFKFDETKTSQVKKQYDGYITY